MAEPIVGDVYRVCLECGHVYNTAKELKKAYRKNNSCSWKELRCMKRELNMTLMDCVKDKLSIKKFIIPADEIFFCQYCIHDF